MPARNPPIRHHALLACEPFSTRTGAERVAAALTAGLVKAGAPAPDAVDLTGDTGDRGAAALLERAGFHERMLASRAVLIAVPVLAESTLAGSAASEVATLARQSGVPCYAVAAKIALNEFDLRILDLQVVIRARGEAGLRRAGEELAAIV